jgi:hypothetical protein
MKTDPVFGTGRPTLVNTQIPDDKKSIDLWDQYWGLTQGLVLVRHSTTPSPFAILWIGSCIFA